MIRLGGFLALALLVFHFGCSSSATPNPTAEVDAGNPQPEIDGAPTAEIDGAIVSPSEVEIGGACDGDPACKSGICYAEKCVQACESPSACGPDEICTSDNGLRTFCTMPTYNATVGVSCGLTGECEGGLQCLGGLGDASAVCTAECKTDADCPAQLTCRAYATKNLCVQRNFCAPCQFDSQCGDGNKCVTMGVGKFCSQTCTSGSSECPRYSTCNFVDGVNVCIHKAGTCEAKGDLCDPCFDATGCKTDGMCLTYNYSKESFCSTSCETDGCSTGYECVSVSTGSGSAKQCVPGETKSNTCVGLSPRMEKGATMVDFEMVCFRDRNKNNDLTDETPELVKLSDFSADYKIILFNVSPGWCPACKAETKDFKSVMTTYEPQGLMIVQAVTETGKQGQPSTLAFVESWIKSLDPGGATVCVEPTGFSRTLNTEGTTPLNLVLDAKTRLVVDKFNGYSHTTLVSKIEQHL